MDPMLTVFSADGVWAYELISRQAMLRAFRNTPAAAHVLPFVPLFYGQPSTFLWRDDAGVVHRIVHAGGGEQGDPQMPALFAVVMWHAAGVRPTSLPAPAGEQPWVGDPKLPAAESGLCVLGTPLGTPEYVAAQLEIWTTSLARLAGDPDLLKLLAWCCCIVPAHNTCSGSCRPDEGFLGCT